MTLIFYLIYDFLLIGLYPLIWLTAFFNKKFSGNLAGQKELKQVLSQFRAKATDPSKKIIWLHAASAGEFEQIKPLLSRLAEKDVYIFQTFTSPTIYYKVFTDKRFHGVSFLPWDTPWRVNWFIKTLQPDIFINTRHDIWPNLLASLKKARVHNILINANLYENSKRLTPVMKQINRVVFNNIDALYTGTENLKQLLSQIYDGPIEVVGDTRFDQVEERAQANTDMLIDQAVIKKREVVIYGSVVDSDLPVITKAIATSLKVRNMLHIVVPHEVSESDLTPWEVGFYREKIKTIRKSELDDYRDEPVILWNAVGQLADLYKHATLAYVGAGFSTGVHSVTEPAIYHVPVAHGPKYDILAEAIELVDMNLSRVVNHPDELRNFIEMDQEERSRLSEEIKEYIVHRLGATDKILLKEF